jgi:hypothetical protein
MRVQLRRRLAAAALAIVLPIAPAAAQVPEQDPMESMPIRFGPLGLSPSLAMTDVGVDSNIFNDAAEPRSDFTATLVPRLVARLRAGPMLLSASNATGFVYFHETKEERAVNYSWDARADFSLDRLQPYFGASLIDTRDRLNAELDIRAPRRSTSVAGGARIALGANTAATFEARRSHLAFDEGITFDGVPLSRTMNDRTDVYDAGLLFALTPLTTLRMTTSWQRDRFEESPGRDADSFRIMPALQFDPNALIQGTLAIGYRRFDPLGPDLAAYQGLAVQTFLGYTLLERTRFDLRLTRDVQYSFEVDEPYYLSTGVRLDVTHQLVGPFDIRATVGRERLGYREPGSDSTSRTDTADLLSAGVGYRLRDDIRLGVAWETARRESARPDRGYDRHRLVASLTYGL